MASPFGFSVGDFIAALELVGTVIDALRASGQSSREYRELLQQLHTLETALLRVKRLDAQDAPANEIAALQETAGKCQRTIDEFWQKIRPYETSMTVAEPQRMRDRWARVKWSICHKDDIKRLRADLTGHTEGILLLLNTIQMSAMALQTRRQRSLAGRLQDAYFQCMARLGSISASVTSGIEQGKQLLAVSSQVLRTNVQIFQAILQLQDLVTRIPSQIDRQPPVFLVDALGRGCPFYLEFIQSREAFMAVLMANFRATGATEKIARNEFAIEDVSTRNDVDLSQDWASVFSPGQRVEMSMVFTDVSRSKMRCPSCGSLNSQWDTEIQCSGCALSFRRTMAQEVEDEAPLGSSLKNEHTATSNDTASETRLIPALPPSLKRKRESSPVGPERFRKVRLKYTNHRLNVNYLKRAMVSELFHDGGHSSDIQGPGYVPIGSGFCAGVFANHEPYLEVVSDSDSSIKLMRYRIFSHDRCETRNDRYMYVKDVTRRNIRLEFDEPSDCQEIWSFVSRYRGWASVRPTGISEFHHIV